MFKNVIPGRKSKSGQFIYNYYSKRFKFNPEDYPKLTTIASQDNCDDFSIRHVIEEKESGIICPAGSFADTSSTPEKISKEKALPDGYIKYSSGIYWLFRDNNTSGSAGGVKYF